MSKDDEKDKSLLDHALESGAEVVTDPFAGEKGIKDILGDEKIVFYPELPRVEFEHLLNQRFMIKAAKFVEKWEGWYGVSDYYLLMILRESGEQFTTLGGGRAIVNQMKKLYNKRNGLPVVVELRQRMGGNGLYYIFE